MVGLWTIRLFVHTHIGYSSRWRAEDMTIPNVIIKTPDRKRTGVWMTSCPEVMAREFGDFEKEVSWDPTLGRASPAGGYGMRSAFVGSDSTVSIVKIVSLSSCRKTKVKKLIKRFVPEQRRVVSISYFPAPVYFTYCFFYRILSIKLSLLCYMVNYIVSFVLFFVICFSFGGVVVCGLRHCFHCSLRFTKMFLLYNPGY